MDATDARGPIYALREKEEEFFPIARKYRQGNKFCVATVC